MSTGYESGMSSVCTVPGVLCSTLTLSSPPACEFDRPTAPPSQPHPAPSLTEEASPLCGRRAKWVLEENERRKWRMEGTVRAVSADLGGSSGHVTDSGVLLFSALVSPIVTKDVTMPL